MSIPYKVRSGMSRILSHPALVWIDTLQATPNPSSVLSSLALQLLLGSSNKMLVIRFAMVRLEKHAGMTHLESVVICMLHSGTVQCDSWS